MAEDELKLELIKLGWRWVYLAGHGDTEAVHETKDGQTMVVGDVEKSMILVPPKCIWDEPVPSNEYY